MANPPDELRVTVGTRVRLRGVMTDADDAAVEGATVTAKAKPPTGPVQTDTADEVVGTPGTYETTFDLTTAGRWYFRFECSVPLAARETSVYVEESDVQ